LWEIIFPFLCGVIAGILALDPYMLKKEIGEYTNVVLFQKMTIIYMMASLLIPLAFVGSVIFSVNELIQDR